MLRDLAEELFALVGIAAFCVCVLLLGVGIR
jgi:hypothetical protein